MADKRRVLLIGDDTRSFLTTLRSLGRQGIEVHVAPYDLGAPALRSKYVSHVHRLPYYLDGGERWLAALEAACAQQKFDLIIPCEERALLPLYRHRDAVEKLCRLAIPDAKGLAALFDKSATRDLAAAAAVPTPRGRLLTAADTCAGLCAEFSLPLVLKPRHSFEWPEIYVRQAATVIQTASQLATWLAANPDHPGRLVVEEYWPGQGAGVSVLCDRGQVLLSFEHHRVSELNGSSYYRRSAAVNQERLNAVAAMTARIGYTGLAMFEFKLNAQSGEWRLLEVNARPWGSLPLPVALGVDFPYALYRLLVEAAPPSHTSYRPGMYGRNFVPDLWQLRSNLHDMQGSAARKVGRLASWLWQFRRVLTGREVQDVWVRDDRAPAIEELRQFMHERLAALRARWRSAFDPAAERLRLATAVRTGSDPLVILFLCQGNICRSPYAELKLKQSMPADAALRIASAGLLPRNSRPSPDAAQAAAGKRGVDLSTHRSRHAFADLASAASLIFIFDDINLRSFMARFPELRDRVFYLSVLGDPAAGREIHDPHGHDDHTFSHTYAKIDVCLENLGAMLKERSR